MKSSVTRDRKRHPKYHMALKGGRTGTCWLQTSSHMEASALSSIAWVPTPVLPVARRIPFWICKLLRGKVLWSSKDLVGMMKGLANKIQRKDSTEPAPQRQETTQSGLSGSLSRAHRRRVLQGALTFTER